MFIFKLFKYWKMLSHNKQNPIYLFWFSRKMMNQTMNQTTNQNYKNFLTQIWMNRVSFLNCQLASWPSFLSRLGRLSNSQDMLVLNKNLILSLILTPTLFFFWRIENIENEIITKVSAIIFKKLVVFRTKFRLLQLL